jgi:arylsulfatase A-like enzyme
MKHAPVRLGFVIAAALAVAGFQPAAAAESSAKPNVLFIAVDDLNDWIGALGGNPDVKTPNLDRLAQRGVLFRRAYCAAPACNPSRVALLTGLRPSSTGVYHNSQPFRPVLPKAVTLPQHFMAHGYRVEGGGKIYHGSYPDKQSWHAYFAKKGDPAPANLPANGIKGTGHFDWGPLAVADEEMDDYKVTQWACSFLKEKQAKPFFLAVGLFRPHLPWYVPQKYFDQFPLDKITLPQVLDTDLDDVPPIGRQMARPDGDHKKVIQSNNWKKAVQGYLASIAFTDACLGQLLDTLDKSPYADNTIIVLWGDHGWHLGEKHHWRKFALWEEATRVPLMITAPGVTKAGGRSDRTVNLIDLYPTLSELCGLPVRPELEGTSLVPQLKDPAAAREQPSVTTHGRENHAVRTERWRYIRYRDGTEELYDHQNDPMEWTNLAAKAEHESLKKELAGWLPKTNAKDAPVQNRKE